MLAYRFDLRSSSILASPFWFCGALLLTLSACQAPGGGSAAGPASPKVDLSPAVADVDDYLIVDCLLPAQVKRLGSRVTYLAARQGTRTSEADCEIRGGEYVAYDRADYKTALAVWQESAEAGDPKAQTYVGQIYERGLGQPADPAKAATWYRLAAEQDYAPAQINLGQLHEQGLGVPRDELAALNLYRQASGFADAQMTYVVSPDVASELQGLRQQVSVRIEESEYLRSQILGLETELADLEQVRETAVGGPFITEEEWAEQQQQLDAARSQLELERGRQRDLERRLEEQGASLAAERQELIAQRARLSEDRVKIDQAEEQMALIEARSAEIARQKSELSAREAELQRREEALRTRQKTIESAPAPQKDAALATGAATQAALAGGNVDQEIDAVRERLQQARQRLFQMFAPDEVALSGPTIELTEPPAGGATLASVRSGGKGGWPVSGEIEAPAGLLSLSLNGRPQAFEGEDGRYRFEATVPAAEGPTEITVIATDEQGKTADVSLILEQNEQRAEATTIRNAAQSDALAELSNVQFGNFHALVIGNSRFASLPALPTAVADAEEIAGVLQERYGFKVNLLRDASRGEILSAFNDYRLQMSEADNLLIYYAGHCEVDPQTDRGYWLPVDAAPESQANWISNTSITSLLDTMQARRIVVVADSCYSGTLSNAALSWIDGSSSPQTRLAWLRTLVDKRSRTALTSGGLAPITAPGARHSAFAEALVGALRANSDVIEGQRLYKAISSQIRSEGDADALAPHYAPIRYTGHEAGDFFFVPLT